MCYFVKLKRKNYRGVKIFANDRHLPAGSYSCLMVEPDGVVIPDVSLTIAPSSNGLDAFVTLPKKNEAIMIRHEDYSAFHFHLNK